jgi:CheY-like chemotaxis protein
MRYYVLIEHKPEGPFDAEDLVSRPAFDGTWMVCSEEKALEEVWVPADSVPELAAGLAARAGGADVPSELPSDVIVATIDESAPSESPAEAAELEPAADVGVDGNAEFDEATDPGRRVILIIDDDAELLDIVATGVRGDGFRAITAIDGKDATFKLSPYTPDLIVTDLMMSRQGGFEFVRALPAMGHPHIPVVVVTGMALDESTIATMRMEANIVDFLTKPISINSLLTLIHEKLGTRRLSPRQKLDMMKNDGWSSGL